MRTRLRTIALVVSLGVGLSACATVDGLNKTAEKLTRDAIAQSEANRCTIHSTPCLSDSQFRAVNLELNKVAVDGREFTKLRIAGKATVADAAHFLATVSAETTTLAGTYTDGAIASVLATLTDLQAKLVKLMGKL